MLRKTDKNSMITMATHRIVVTANLPLKVEDFLSCLSCCGCSLSVSITGKEHSPENMRHPLRLGIKEKGSSSHLYKLSKKQSGMNRSNFFHGTKYLA